MRVATQGQEGSNELCNDSGGRVGAGGNPCGTVGILDLLALLANWGPCP